GKGREGDDDKVPLWAFAVFLAAALVSALVSDAPGLGMRIAVTGGVAPVAVWLVARRAVRHPVDIRWLAFGLFGLVIQTGVYALANFNEQALAASGNLAAFGGVSDMSASVRIFTVPSAGMAVLLPVVPLAAWHALHGEGRRSRGIVAGLVMVLALVSVLLSFSRGSWLAAAAAVLLSLPLLFRRIRPGWVLVAVGAAALFVAAGGSEVAAELLRFRIEGTNSAHNISGRANNYLLALASAPRYLLFGVGPGQYPAVYAAFPEAAASWGTPLWFAHSLLLTLIPEIGLLGAVAFGLPLFRSVAQGMRGARLKDRAGAFGYAVAAGVTGYLVVASTAGTHLVTYLNTARVEGTWFTAPALIVTLGLVGAAEGVRKTRGGVNGTVPGAEAGAA
ncbi:MAG TPA: O-antigen ligase domain-containing protein, partial [candidate division WOR-3 bacterium]|nr:O-antigen ligase domain-containing protein [candidate division WOR-3 bacterium]